MINNTSILVGLKNNLSYSKNFYYTTRALYPDVELVFTSYGSTDGTHEWLDSLNDPHLLYYYSTENKTFSDTYNQCTRIATKEYVVFAHNDMVLTNGFIENLQKHYAPQNIIYYTTIEPPVFADDARPGKIVKDFGSDIDSLNTEGLYKFSAEIRAELHNQTNQEQRVSFFLSAPKVLLINIGGLDPLFNPMFCEDDDLILRFLLLDLNIFTALDAISYHFVSKTSRFSEEYQARTQQIELNSNKNFVRKWGFSNSASVKKKYNIGIIVKNGTADILSKLEPWCSTIYIDCDKENYIAKEQPNTDFDLNKRIQSLDAPKSNDILISLNGNAFNDEAYNQIKQLSQLLTKRLNRSLSFFDKITGKNNTDFSWKMLKFQVTDNKTYEHQLITINATEYVF
jgi:GT2 family glycosyltransferase